MMKKAEALAADGLDTAKSTARQLYEEATNAVAEKGLTPDAVRQVAESAGKAMNSLSSDETSRSAQGSANGENARSGDNQ